MFQGYQTEGFYDEMVDSGGNIRPAYQALLQKMEVIGADELNKKQLAAEHVYVSMGVTFNVYQEGKGLERTIPFDSIPRIINHTEWKTIESGLQQRVTALDRFCDDIYNHKYILKDKILPEEVVYSSPGYLKQCEGLKPAKGRWTHICGIDLIKHTDGEYYVLEDNLRVPSGVSYVLTNREIMKRVFPDVFTQIGVYPIYNYGLKLLEMLQELSPSDHPNIVVLTPGVFNSAYFEHSFLAQQMGVELVEGRDLVVIDNFLYMITTKGPKKVDVIYRRVDDTYLDPLVFNPDSMLGVPGLFDVYKRGNVVIANAPGTGVADDKVIYAYVPKIINYYLDEQPIIQNVPTYLCGEDKDRHYVLDHLREMVVKMDNQSGGYGMLIGPQASDNQIQEFRMKIRSQPRNYIAQPVMSLSRVPTMIDGVLEGRHVDFRPFVLYGKGLFVMPGGLSRVALKKGSLVVNSSQGGGSKDTWVLSKPLEGESKC
ncbi:MAG: circularly permuted type 2 ATP-grasp protein [Candidatus Omnitrophica bacterium]|nr:circularly permuted type 2 ATP-grasp protein [Candidatus Omnitrophota bacterium]